MRLFMPILGTGRLCMPILVMSARPSTTPVLACHPASVPTVRRGMHTLWVPRGPDGALHAHPGDECPDPARPWSLALRHASSAQQHALCPNGTY